MKGILRIKRHVVRLGYNGVDLGDLRGGSGACEGQKGAGKASVAVLAGGTAQVAGKLDADNPEKGELSNFLGNTGTAQIQYSKASQGESVATYRNGRLGAIVKIGKKAIKLIKINF